MSGARTKPAILVFAAALVGCSCGPRAKTEKPLDRPALDHSMYFASGVGLASTPDDLRQAYDLGYVEGQWMVLEGVAKAFEKSCREQGCTKAQRDLIDEMRAMQGRPIR